MRSFIITRPLTPPLAVHRLGPNYRINLPAVGATDGARIESTSLPQQVMRGCYTASASHERALKLSALSLAVSAALLVMPMALRAQESATSPLAGCYVLTLGPWAPDLGPNRPFHVPPDSIRLDLTSDPFQPDWYRAGPTIQHPYAGNRARAAWQPRRPSGFRVVWSDGYTGADLTLAPEPDGSFKGAVVAVSDRKDDPALVPRARVAAKRVACPT